MIEMKERLKFGVIPMHFEMLGVGIIKIPNGNLDDKLDIIFQKGIGLPLIHNIIELCRNEISTKDQGNSIIPVKNYTIFLHYFQNKGDIIIVLFMEKKTNSLSYPQLYLLIKSIRNNFRLNLPIAELIDFCNDTIEIPHTEGIIGVFIIGACGTLYLSKINNNRTTIVERSVTISGFISALFSFSQEVIGKDTGAVLKEINFGNQRFFMIIKEKVIFAFLVEKVNSILQRYMYQIADDFLDRYRGIIKRFNGDVSQFYDFEKIIDQYFLI